MRLLLRVQNKHPNAAGSLEGFAQAADVRVPWSINADLAHRDPALLAEIVEHAKVLAAAPRVG